LEQISGEVRDEISEEVRWQAWEGVYEEVREQITDEVWRKVFEVINEKR